jgi:hypothetical protein
MGRLAGYRYREPEGTLRAILRQAGVDVHEFLGEDPGAKNGLSATE